MNLESCAAAGVALIVVGAFVLLLGACLLRDAWLVAGAVLVSLLSLEGGIL